MCASAGKNDSIESSETGHVHRGPEPGQGAEEGELLLAGADPQRGGDLGHVEVGRLGGVAARVGGQLLVQGEQRRVAGDHGAAAEPLEDVGAPLAEVDDPRRHPLGVQAQPQRVHRRLEQVLGGAAGEQLQRPVAGDQAPVAVDDEGGVGVVAGEHPVDRLAHRAHLGVGEVVLGVGGGVAGGEQQRVSLPQRDLELLGEPGEHLGARLRAAGLDEAQMPRRDPGLERQVELAEAPALAPVAQHRADGRALGCRRGGHALER